MMHPDWWRVEVRDILREVKGLVQDFRAFMKREPEKKPEQAFLVDLNHIIYRYHKGRERSSATLTGLDMPPGKIEIIPDHDSQPGHGPYCRRYCAEA
jgi:hypothetical protein